MRRQEVPVDWKLMTDDLGAELAVLTHARGQVFKGGAGHALQRFAEVLRALLVSADPT